MVTEKVSPSIAIGGDHAGYSMKTLVAKHLGARNVSVVDCGFYDESPSDFPDVAEKVSMKLLSGEVERGIIVCGSGVGVSVAANKIPGIRAGLCHDTYSAHQGVEHDDMNVLCIGARIIGSSLAIEIVDTFLAARYSPEARHQKRVDKINEIEQKNRAGRYDS